VRPIKSSLPELESCQIAALFLDERRADSTPQGAPQITSLGSEA
jgi:hypothetical protein